MHLFTCVVMFIASLFIITQTKNKQNLHDIWINKLWLVYTIEYYRALRMDEFQTTHTHNITNMLSEWNQTQKTISSMIPFMSNKKTQAELVWVLEGRIVLSFEGRDSSDWRGT